MTKPIIYLAFANDQLNPLLELTEESKTIYRHLELLKQRDYIGIERENFATVKDMLHTLSMYSDQLTIFHYGGHADGGHLQFEDNHAIVTGLAQLLSEHQLLNLKLVFLNGCSTQGQVKTLLQAGVKAVIATSRPVGDDRASFFAATFYQGLAQKRTIKWAFEFAKGALETQFNRVPSLQIYRSFAFEEADNLAESPFEWGLYVQHDEEVAILNYRLPYYRTLGFEHASVRQYIEEKFEVNREIVMVLDDMCRYNKDIYTQMVHTIGGVLKPKDSSTYPNLVIKNFPWIIGAQIQLLRQKSQLDRSRLEQLFGTYITASQVIFYILLSDIWQLRFKHPDAEFDHPFIGKAWLTKSNLLHINYLKHIQILYKWIQQHDFQIFVPELAELYDALQHNEQLQQAIGFFEEFKLKIDAIEQEGSLSDICLDAEYALRLFLEKIAFLANYKMLTVRNITLENPRFAQQLQYDLNMGQLNALVETSLSLYQDQTYRKKSTYSDCRSVVLVKAEDDMSHFLNLSPFIMDKNTFLNASSIDLFMYGYATDNKHYYLAIKHNIFMALENEKGTDILDTDLTREDFDEGFNIDKNKKVKKYRSRFGRHNTVKVSNKPKVFQLLIDQMVQFNADFS